MRRIRAVSILGGMPYPKQMQLLAKNPEILVATPGRLIDHMESGKIDFSQLEILVLDEADRMLDMGFIEDIEKIVAATPDSRQTMLFSATLDGVVGNMARRITKDPMVIQIASGTKRHENITQKVHFVDDLSHKNRLLDHLLRDETMDQAVVFTATKRDADMIADRLNIAGFAAAALHGDMHQGARNRTLDSMRRGQVRVLVPGRLRAPHRPHGPRRPQRYRRLAREPRGKHERAPHRTLHQADHPGRCGGRLRTQAFGSTPFGRASGLEAGRWSQRQAGPAQLPQAGR
jgi:superfamily II DNA/RNA helicase